MCDNRGVLMSLKHDKVTCVCSQMSTGTCTPASPFLQFDSPRKLNRVEHAGNQSKENRSVSLSFSGHNYRGNSSSTSQDVSIDL